MQTEIVPFPAGAWQGVVTLRCDITPSEPLSPDLLSEIRARATEGVQLLWINTERWGDEQFEQFMLQLSTDQRLESFMVTAIRPLTAPKWSALSIEWVIDISDVFSTKEMVGATLRSSAEASVWVPRMRELIWREPPIGNVTPAALEAISDRLQPDVQSWLYIEDADLAQRAFSSAANAAALWGVREKVGGAWPTTM